MNPQIKTDPRFDGMSLEELNELCGALVAAGPPDDPSDAEFLRALAKEIGLRKSREQS